VKKYGPESNGLAVKREHRSLGIVLLQKSGKSISMKKPMLMKHRPIEMKHEASKIKSNFPFFF